MAKRGRTPKPTHLHLVDGSYRPDRHGLLEDRPPAAMLERWAPRGMKGEARKAWERFIAPAIWLDQFHEPAAIAFCELWAGFRQRPASFTAALHAQMRAYMRELGLTDERQRRAEEKLPKDEFFD